MTAKTKYNIVLVDALSNDCEILQTTEQLNNAIEYMTK